MAYTEGFKSKMVQRMAAPNGMSASALSREVGVSQAQLSRWFQAARNVVVMPKEPISARVEQTTGNTRSAAEKLRLVMAASALSDDELGAFLRREGVHAAELEQWRAAVSEAGQAALEGGTGAPRGRTHEVRRIRELERELQRKEKALAETAALLVLQKKVREIWGDVDDDIDETNEK